MRNKKNGLLTFLCSLVPGAGEMFMGLYKQGISLMFLFFAVAALGIWANLEVLWAVLPVVWCFSFFHTHNLQNMTQEEFMEQEDHYYGFEEIDFKKADEFLKRNTKIVAAILIIFGFCMLAQIFMNMLNPYFDGIFWDLAWRLNHNVTQIILAAALILGGIKLLQGNWKQTPKEENVVE